MNDAFAGCLRAARGEPVEGDLVLVGLPDDSRSSLQKGASAGPQAVRRCYDRRCYNSSTESGAELSGLIADLGDWAPGGDWEETRRRYRDSAKAIFRTRAVPFFIGGDHAVTVPVVEALSALPGPVYVIQVDAHPDLYPDYQGDHFSHGCTGLRILEMEHVAMLIQMGIRTMNPLQASQAQRFEERIRILPARELLDALPYPEEIPRGAEVYLTLDIDALDPSCAPGVAHPVPGGLASRQLLNWIQGFPWRLAGMDVVEVNPGLDLNGQTAVLAGRLLHEAMGRAIV